MSSVLANGLGAALIFSFALGLAWLAVKLLGLSWDVALLVQVLWLTALNRWHQPDSPTNGGSARE